MADLDQLAGLENTSFVAKVAQVLKEESKTILDAEIASPASQDVNELSFAQKVWNGEIDNTNFTKNLLTHPGVVSIENPFNATDSQLRAAVSLIFPTAAFALEN